MLNKQYIYEAGINPASSSAIIIDLVGNNKSVLEVGCASGSQSKVLKQNGNTVTGLDIDSKAAAKAEKYCDSVIVGDISKMNVRDRFPGKHFDVVMFADVLEHLYNPNNVLENISAVLKDDGYILASIPNIVHASIIMEMIRGRFEYNKFGLLDDTHIRFFTKNTICQMFESAGYCISHIHRRTMHPRHTEFRTTTSTPEEQAVLDYILKSSPESDTYQFIVKAYKANGSTQSNFSLCDEKMELEKQLAATQDRLKNIESQLNWMNTRLHYRLAKKLTKFFGRCN